MQKTARYELILKLFTMSSIRRSAGGAAQQLTYMRRRYTSLQKIQYFPQVTLIGTALNRLGTPSSDTNITNIISTVSTSAACGLRIYM